MPGPGAMPRIKLLVVEDELLVALDLCMMVEDLGFDVAGPAPSTEKALALLEAERIDAALLDENLGGVLVSPLAQELERRGIPFGIVSGHGRSPSDDPLLQRALRAPKPASPAQIRELIRALLG